MVGSQYVDKGRGETWDSSVEGGGHSGPRGGGVLSLEKGTDCGPTAGERSLSGPVKAKKGGLSLYYIEG